MADFTYSAQAGEPQYVSGAEFTTSIALNRMTTWTNIAGAAVSFVLVIGVAIWGYKLMMRDVSGIPVVRAAAGEMRVRPEEPGGQLAQHQGLSVNAVAAEGTAARPADELRLAPQPVDITAQDQVVQAAMVAPTPQPEAAPSTETPDVAAALQAGEVEDLVAQLTAGVTPLADLPAATTEDVTTLTPTPVAAVQETPEEVVNAVLDAPGVRQSLRPRKRPARPVPVVQASVETGAQATQPAAPASNEIDPESLPAGTRLAQLGAYDSEQVAREQWDQLSQRFNVYLGDKQRIIQKATSGGRVFYRLRAMGFEDIADARRFCSALVAENADCIPVVTR